MKLHECNGRFGVTPEFLQGKSPKTVLRHIHRGNIPFEKNEGEKAYRIPSTEYYQSLSHDGKSIWFQNHTRE